MSGKEFAKWMDETGMDLASAATHFGVSPQTIYNWRSTNGIPTSRDEWVRTRMKDHLASKQLNALPDRITLEVSRNQFDDWSRAALAEGKILREWAIDALDEAAAEDETQHSTGSGAPFNPIQSLKVAEPGEDYRPKKGNGA